MNEISYILQNTLGPIAMVFIFLLYFFIQTKTFGEKSLFFLKSAYKRQNIIFSFSLTSILITLYILIGGFIEIRIPQAAHTATIFEINFNLAFICIITFLMGCFYASIVAVFGNIFAFLIFQGSGGFLFTFTLVRGIMPIVPFMLMLLLKKTSNPKSNNLIFTIIFFTFSLLTLLFSILVFAKVINANYSSKSEIAINSFRYSILFTSIALNLIFIFIAVLIKLKKLDNYINNFFWTAIFSMLLYEAIISIVFDPILSRFIAGHIYSYQELIALKLPTIMLSFFFNSWFVYIIPTILVKYKRFNFLITKIIDNNKPI